ncbi:MAG: SCP2 sterol-binding domain-containing protein [Granulosicoccus sp.]|nr:SCP2 sterol-binding domain-containing protein [Granulosicoccus sp.]
MQLPLPFLLTAQKVFEHILTSQPDINSHLLPLDGRIACIHVDSIDLPVYLIFNGDQVEIARFFDGEVDVTLSGSAQALIALTKNTDGMFNGDITIVGDTGLAHQLKSFFDAIDIDWEEQLASIIGDASAHQLGNIHRNASSWMKRTFSGFLADSGEYLQEEAAIVAPNSEVRRYCSEVDELRSGTDRLEARINQLRNKAAGTDRS